MGIYTDVLLVPLSSKLSLLYEWCVFRVEEAHAKPILVEIEIETGGFWALLGL